MTELKTQKTDASVDAFLQSVDDDNKRQDCYTVLEIMAKITGKPATMYGANMVGFGSYRYRYASGRSGEWFLTGFSPRKQNLVLYIMSGFSNAEKLMSQLGKHKTGKSCLYIRRLEDLDMVVLETLVTKSVEYMRGQYDCD